MKNLKNLSVNDVVKTDAFLYFATREAEKALWACKWMPQGVEFVNEYRRCLDSVSKLSSNQRDQVLSIGNYCFRLTMKQLIKNENDKSNGQNQR